MKLHRLCIAILLPLVIFAQTPLTPPNPAPPSPFLGAVPDGSTATGEIPLTIQDSITRALKYNLGAQLASDAERAARAERIIALSRMLPNITAKISETSQQVSLTAFGLPVGQLPGIPAVVGPFGITDMRGALTQQIMNFKSINQTRASTQNVKAAEFNFRDARETVILVVSSLYLQAASGASRIEASKAQVATAQALFDQAADFKKAGKAPGIDVLRAQVELQSQKQKLIVYLNDFEKEKLGLARAIGLPDGVTIRLADAMPDGSAPLPELEQALDQAYAQRKDYLSQQSRVTAAEFSSKAARSGYLPSIDFNGNYGVIGPTPMQSNGTYAAAISLNIPIWEGGRVKGEVEEADANLRQVRAQLADLRGRIGYEVRTSILDLNAAREQLEVNRSSVSLAKETERQARDRFAAGVTNNLEVVQAQEALATANENLIGSLYSYNVAKASLARAIGAAETKMIDFLQGGRQ